MKERQVGQERPSCVIHGVVLMWDGLEERTIINSTTMISK